MRHIFLLCQPPVDCNASLYVLQRHCVDAVRHVLVEELLAKDRAPSGADACALERIWLGKGGMYHRKIHEGILCGSLVHLWKCWKIHMFLFSGDRELQLKFKHGCGK